MMSYLPDVEALRRSVVPLTVLAGEESRAALPETYRPSEWLADQLGVELREIPRAHVPYFDRPQAFVDSIRPFIEGAI
jgi:pimeloyl-ACP methyl ester carboxylesterase